MTEIKLFNRKKNLIIVFIACCGILIGVSLFFLFNDVKGWPNIIVGFSSLVVGLMALRQVKRNCFFRYNNTIIEYRFPHMELQKEINIEGISSVKEEWYGISFVNSDGQTVKFSTDGLSKREKQKVVQLFIDAQNLEINFVV